MASQKQYVAVWPSGHHLRWRGLSMREYQMFSRRLESEPEMIVYCDLFRLVASSDQSPLEFTTAGIVDFLGQLLLKNSAFDSNIVKVQQSLDAQRAALQTNYLESCKAVLAGVFRYTFEEIEEWDEQTFFERLAKAELISGEDLSPKPVDKSGKPTSNKPQKAPKKPLTNTQARVLERSRAAHTST